MTRSSPTVDSSIETRHKILFILFNLVLWTSGLVLLWFGVWLEVEFTRYIRSEYKVVSFFLIGTGSLLILFNSMACFCAIKGESAASLLHPYGLVLGVLFVAELLLSVSMLWLKQRLQLNFNEDVNMQEGPIDMDLIQSSLNCCGLRGFGDWVQLVQASSNSSAHHLSIPSSCCSLPNCDTRNLDNLWPQGCVSQMENFIDNNVGVMSLLVLSFAAVTLLGVFCSFSFARKVSVSSYEVIGD